MDRELDAAPLLERAQLMCAQVGALQALNKVRAEMHEQPCTRLADAVQWGMSMGLLSRREGEDLYRLNRSANAAKHYFE